MDDLIGRQAVLEAIDVKAWEFCDYLISKNRNDEQKPVSHFADNLRECVREELPSVNPQERTGHWIIMGDRCIKCSECGHITKTESPDIYNFCMVCGANMSEIPTSSKPEISSYYGLKSYVRERSE